MDCIFNELSVQLVASATEACDVMARFIRAVGTVQPFGLSRIRIPEQLGKDLFSLPLAPNYAVGAWLNDDRVSHDLKDRFRLIVANPPLLTDDEVEELSLFDRSVFCLHAPAGTPEAKGFGAAHLSDSLLTSLSTGAQWNTQQLQGWHWYLDQTGLEQTAQVTVRHFATSYHAEQHISWLQQRQIAYLQRSADVWEKRAEFFRI